MKAAAGRSTHTQEMSDMGGTIPHHTHRSDYEYEENDTLITECHRTTHGDRKVEEGTWGCRATQICNRCTAIAARCMEDASSSEKTLACVMILMIGVVICFIMAATVEWTVNHSTDSVHGLHHTHGYWDTDTFNRPQTHAKAPVSSSNTSETYAANPSGQNTSDNRPIPWPIPLTDMGMRANVQEKDAVKHLQESLVFNNTMPDY